MVRENDISDFQNLPSCAVVFIKQVLKKMRYRRKVRQDVKEELTAHFADELKDCETDEDKEEKAKQLIADFGDAKLLAVLLRRAKKRCRPLWRTAVVRSFQVFGIMVLYCCVCFIPLLVGKPTISVNYIDWLNELVKSDRNESDNARPFYEKAAALYVENPKWLDKNRAKWPTDLNDVEQKSLSDWLEDNQGALESLREGSKRPDFWNEYQNGEATVNNTQLYSDLMASGFVDNVMEILSTYKSLTRALRWQVLYEAYNGDIETALRDCIAITKFGGHLQGHGLLIEQLVGFALEGLANSTIFILLDRVDVPADILKSTYQELNEQFDTQESVLSLESEKVFWYDQIQRTFTDDGNGGGRMLARGMPYVVTDDWKENLWRFVSFNYPDRQEVVGSIDKYFGRFAEKLTKTPWELRDETIDDQVWNEVDITPIMLKIQIPAHERVGQITWRMKSGRKALLTVLAVMRYEKENGRYPANLSELVEAGYLKRLPMDPYSDGPLVYRRTESGFLLYSLGTNLKDDGGELGLRGGKPRMWADDGDWIFWPVAE
ncbi:MAG: hypothetical protein RQ760_12365 [Sedimentisphaerales bacterium]|nr:hypothetical protein [Sedimentisphaerales bacterium]